MKEKRNSLCIISCDLQTLLILAKFYFLLFKPFLFHAYADNFLYFLSPEFSSQTIQEQENAVKQRDIKRQMSNC